MREILTVADRIEDLTRELPVSNYAGFLEEINYKIRKMAAQDYLHIDVYRSVNAYGESRKIIKQLEESAISTGMVLNIKDENNCSIKVFEQIFPAIAFVFLDEEMLQSEELKLHYRKNDEQYKVVFLVNLLTDDKEIRDFSRLFGFRTKVINLTLADFSGKHLPEILNASLDNSALDKLKKLSFLNSIKPVFAFLNDILSSESKSANTRKLLNTQNTNITRKEEQTLNQSELTSSLRLLIQKSGSELEKSYKFKYEDLNKPNTGKFSIVAQEETNSLTDFNKKELAEKSERVETSIDPKFLEKFTSNIGNTIKSELAKDEAFIKSSFEDIIGQINTQLKAKGVKPVKSSEIFPPLPG